MRVRNRGKNQEDVELQMTPMIDIVFQLLVFFIMTFKIVAEEGDFTVKMPISSVMTQPIELKEVQSVTVTLKAGENGQLSTASWDQEGVFYRIPEEYTQGKAIFPDTKEGKDSKTASEEMFEQKFGREFVAALRAKVEEHLVNLPGVAREKAEIEFECDYNLKYIWTIRAVTASNGKKEGNKIVPLIESIKFSQPVKKK